MGCQAHFGRKAMGEPVGAPAAATAAAGVVTGTEVR